MPDCATCGQSNAPDAIFCADPRCAADLRRAAAPAPRLPPIPPEVTNLYRPVCDDGGPAPIPARSRSSRVERHGLRIRLKPAELRVEPGDVGTVTLALTNTGSQSTEFQLALAGGAAGFGTVTPPSLRVPPGAERTAVVSFRPRRGSDAPAGWAQYTVHARASRPGGATSTAHGTVVVAAFTAIAARLDPALTSGRTAGAAVLTLVNEGNTTVRVQGSFQDRDGVVRVHPDRPFAIMYPADVVDIPLTVRGPRRLFGRPAEHPFQAVVQAPGLTQPVAVHGMRRQLPTVPWWAPVIVVALAALAGLVALPGGPVVPALTGWG